MEIIRMKNKVSKTWENEVVEDYKGQIEIVSTVQKELEAEIGAEIGLSDIDKALIFIHLFNNHRKPMTNNFENLPSDEDVKVKIRDYIVSKLKTA